MSPGGQFGVAPAEPTPPPAVPPAVPGPTGAFWVGLADEPEPEPMVDPEPVVDDPELPDVPALPVRSGLVEVAALPEVPELLVPLFASTGVDSNASVAAPAMRS